MLIPIRDHNPTRRFPFVTVGLIVVNTIVFLMQQFDPHIMLYYSAIPAEVLRNEPGVIRVPVEVAPGWARMVEVQREVAPQLTIFTSMFLHGGWLHLIGNMWSLWIFGNNVEDTLGHWRYLILYLVWGYLAAWSHILPNMYSDVPVVGASGAIAGVMGAYALLFPHARLDCVLLFFVLTFVEVPAIFFLIFWFVSQFFVASPGVAYLAHIGGFVAGLATVKLLGGRDALLGYRRYYWDE
ncbi:Rhomboid protease GluP [bacterium HR15]|nr:Rhomboid protease GluP [bacterium HR15]